MNIPDNGNPWLAYLHLVPKNVHIDSAKFDMRLERRDENGVMIVTEYNPDVTTREILDQPLDHNQFVSFRLHNEESLKTPPLSMKAWSDNTDIPVNGKPWYDMRSKFIDNGGTIDMLIRMDIGVIEARTQYFPAIAGRELITYQLAYGQTKFWRISNQQSFVKKPETAVIGEPASTNTPAPQAPTLAPDTANSSNQKDLEFPKLENISEGGVLFSGTATEFCNEEIVWSPDEDVERDMYEIGTNYVKCGSADRETALTLAQDAARYLGGDLKYTKKIDSNWTPDEWVLAALVTARKEGYAEGVRVTEELNSSKQTESPAAESQSQSEVGPLAAAKHMVSNLLAGVGMPRAKVASNLEKLKTLLNMAQLEGERRDRHTEIMSALADLKTLNMHSATIKDKLERNMSFGRFGGMGYVMPVEALEQKPFDPARFNIDPTKPVAHACVERTSDSIRYYAKLTLEGHKLPEGAPLWGYPLDHPGLAKPE